ncbi:MAG: C39 family peptidase [Bacteroidetes bacterium]|nr:C39 family peptidase [Bacteroidota bacterium]
MFLRTPYRPHLFLLLLMPMVFTPAFASAPEQPFRSPRMSAAGVLFADDRQEGLFLLTGSGIEVISRMPGSGMYYSVSPDGRSVGYKEVRGDGSQTAHLYDLQQRRSVMLPAHSTRVGQISFAENGTLAYTDGEHVVVLSGHTEQRIALGVYANIAPLSPDGRRVVYNDDADQLWVLEINTGVKERITDGTGSYALPVWSPDGSRILYSRLSGSMHVYSLQEKSTVLLGDGDSPSWLDASTVVYVQRIIDRGSVTGSELVSVTADGTQRRHLTGTADRQETESWCDRASGTVLFSDETQGGLYLRNVAAGTEQQISTADRSVLNVPRSAAAAVPETPVTAAAAYFEMPYVHQVWDTPDWYNGHSACGATSSIMVIAYFNIVPPWNVWCSPSGSSPGHYSPYGNYVCENYTYREYAYALSAEDPNGKPSYGGYGFMWTGSYSPYSRTVDYYTNHGMTASRFDSSASFFSTVIANVDSGYPFTLCNGLTAAGHIIVVNGYDVNNRTLIVNDPYGNKNTGVYPSLNGKGVKYDWVGYNNGYRNLNRIYWGVSVRYPKVARADTLVDDMHLGKGFFMSTAAPSSLTRWSDRKTGGWMNNHFWWTRTKMSDTCYAVWTPSLPRSGDYLVEAYIPVSDATKARYLVTAQNGQHTVVVNQKSYKNAWAPLGTFPFAAGTASSVRLGDGSDTLKQAVIFDAVRWTYAGTPLAVGPASTEPRSFALEQNYPNPFNPSTEIRFSLPQRSMVTLTVSDLLGKNVARLTEGMLEAGTHRVRFAAEQYGLSSGIYLYTLHAGGRTQTKRMILMK